MLARRRGIVAYMGSQGSKAAGAAYQQIVRKYPNKHHAAAPPIVTREPQSDEQRPALKPSQEEIQLMNQKDNKLVTMLYKLSDELDPHREMPAPLLTIPEHSMPKDRSVSQTPVRNLEEPVRGKVSATGLVNLFRKVRSSDVLNAPTAEEFGIPKTDFDKMLKHYSVPVVYQVSETRADCYFEAYPEWTEKVVASHGTLTKEFMAERGAEILNLSPPKKTIESLDYSPKDIPPQFQQDVENPQDAPGSEPRDPTSRSN